MTPRRKKHLALIVIAVLAFGLAIGLTTYALRQNINLFYTPTQVAEGLVSETITFRVGGLVREGSIFREQGSLDVQFTITDAAHDVTILYQGILPDLFREGQGIVAQGSLNYDGVFEAKQVLAKHDENYMPPEAQHALQQAQK